MSAIVRFRNDKFIRNLDNVEITMMFEMGLNMPMEGQMLTSEPRAAREDFQEATKQKVSPKMGLVLAGCFGDRVIFL